jgi:hypothetical protein
VVISTKGRAMLEKVLFDRNLTELHYQTAADLISAILGNSRFDWEIRSNVPYHSEHSASCALVCPSCALVHRATTSKWQFIPHKTLPRPSPFSLLPSPSPHPSLSKFLRTYSSRNRTAASLTIVSLFRCC